MIARVRAALVLISPDHITPMGRRILDQVLDQETSFLDAEDGNEHDEHGTPLWWLATRSRGESQDD